MKELLQAVDIEKCIAFWKKGIASLIICSMLMIDVAKAMDPDEDDPRLSSNIHRTPSSTPAADLRNIDDGSPEKSSSSIDEDLSPRSISPTSIFPITGRDIIGSKPNSDDSGSSTSSPEKSPPEGNQGLPIIPFSAFSPSSSRNIISVLSPSSFPCELQPDFGTPPGAESFPDRVPLRSPKNLPGARKTSSRYQEAGSSEKDPLLSSGSSSYGSSHSNSSHSSSQSSDSSSDAEEDVELGGLGHPQPESQEPSGGLQGTLEQFLRRFASTQPLQSSQGQNGTPHERAEDQENVGAVPLLMPGHPSTHSIQSYGPGDDELSVDFDLDGDENASPSSQSRFLPTCLSEWFSERPFWPKKPEYTLPEGALDRASQFLEPLRSRQAAESHASSSDGERSSSFSASNSSGSSGSDSPTHGSPPYPRHAAALPADSESDGEGSITHLLPPTYPHDVVRDYASLRGILPAARAAFPFPHDLDSTGAATSQPQTLSQEAWLQFLDDVNDLAAKIKTRLKKTYQDLNGDVTWIDWVALAIAVVIGVGFAYGMEPVYDGGLMYLANISEAFNEFWLGNASNYLILYIMYSAGPDGIARNFNLWKKGIASLFSPEKTEIGRMFAAGGIAVPTAFIPVAYLILAENIGRQGLHLPNWDNEFGRAVIARGIPLYIDAFIKDLDIALNSFDRLWDWFRQARQVFFPSSLPPPMKSDEALQREKFDHDLTKLQHFLAGASDAVIEAIYNDVQDVIAGARSEEDLAAQQAFAKICFTLSLADQVQEVTKKYAKKSIAELAFEGLEYFGLIFGAPTALLLLQLVFSTVASLGTSNRMADFIGEGFAVVAFLPFMYILAQYMDSFKNLVFNKDPRGHESHPAVRWPVKIFIGIQSLLYLFQTSIAVLQSYNKWFGEGWWPFAAAAPFLAVRLTGFLNGFYETFNEQVTTTAIKAYHWVEGKCGRESSCSGCRRNKLIDDIKSIQSNLKHFDPELIHNLTKGIEIFKDEESSP